MKNLNFEIPAINSSNNFKDNLLICFLNPFIKYFYDS